MKIYLRLIKYIKPYLVPLITGIVFTSIQSGLNVYYMPLFNKFVENMSGTLSRDELIRVSVTFGVCSIGAVIFRYFGDYLFYYVSNNLSRELREVAYQKVIYMPVTFFEKMTTGHIFQRIGSDTSIMQRGVTILSRDFIGASIKIMGFFGYLLYLNWVWTLSLLICVPILVKPMAMIAKKIKGYARQVLDITGDINSSTKEMCDGIRVIKSYGLETPQVDRYKALNMRQCSLTMKSIKYSELSRPISFSLIAGLTCMLLYFSGMEVINGKITFAEYVTYIVTCSALQAPVKVFGAMMGKLQESMVAAERVFELLDTKNEIELEPSDCIREPLSLNDSIEFRDVSFAYPGADAQALSNLSLTLKKGETVALVGPSGAGKTTLSDLLLRFYPLEHGGVYVDGHPVEEYSHEIYRRLFALVNQHTFLFDDSVSNNIAFGSNGAVTHAQVESAARDAEAHNFILELESGYDTRLGELGSRLSGGQRQRIAIARALVRNAPVLVLDEATSSLDSESERLVQEGLDRLMQDKTVLVIAHRMSTIQNADRIVVMTDGQIVDQGDHQSLLERNETYRGFCKRQGEAG